MNKYIYIYIFKVQLNKTPLRRVEFNLKTSIESADLI